MYQHGEIDSILLEGTLFQTCNIYIYLHHPYFEHPEKLIQCTHHHKLQHLWHSNNPSLMDPKPQKIL